MLALAINNFRIRSFTRSGNAAGVARPCDEGLHKPTVIEERLTAVAHLSASCTDAGHQHKQQLLPCSTAHDCVEVSCAVFGVMTMPRWVSSIHSLASYVMRTCLETGSSHATISVRSPCALPLTAIAFSDGVGTFIPTTRHAALPHLARLFHIPHNQHAVAPLSVAASSSGCRTQHHARHSNCRRRLHTVASTRSQTRRCVSADPLQRLHLRLQHAQQ